MMIMLITLLALSIVAGMCMCVCAHHNITRIGLPTSQGFDAGERGEATPSNNERQAKLTELGIYIKNRQHFFFHIKNITFSIIFVP
jgi:hypothetical protein